ncbi:ribulose-phosphate 3-epimerase [bacterium]|nr:ribulose-phosphate 3-epimerase [bacterium]
MKVLIAPSILAADLSCLGEEIARAVRGGCDAIHIDIMDHHFVPNLSFGPDIVKTVRHLTDLPLDVHLMADNPLDMIESFAKAGSDYLTIHIEVLDNAIDALAAIDGLGVCPGLSLKPDTPVEAVIPYLDHVDILLVMSVFPGFGGQSFIEESYSRVSSIAEAASKLETPPYISVDGGVDFVNAPKLVKAGVNFLVAGSSIFRDHGAMENIRRMREALNT